MNRYASLMARLEELMVDTLPEDRVVSRRFMDFADRPEAHLQAGVFTLLPLGTTAYPYERSDDTDGVSARGTDVPTFGFQVIAQGVLHESQAGADIDDAEFEFLAELETFADEAMHEPGLEGVRIVRAQQSSQLEAPYCWVAAEFTVEHVPDPEETEP